MSFLSLGHDAFVNGESFSQRVPHQDNGVRIHVTKLLVRESGTYNAQHHRTYQAKVYGEHLSMFERMMQENSSTIFTPTRVAGTLAGMVGISAEPTDNRPVAIDNGWQDRRLMFVIEVDVHQGLGKFQYVVQGFTNYSGVSLQHKHLDPEMIFYVNNVVEQRVDQIRGVNGMRDVPAMTSNYQLLSNAHTATMGQFDNTQVAVRPQDVFSISAMNNIMDFSEKNVYQSANQIKSTPIASRRSNNSPASYASNILNSYSEPYSRIEVGQTGKDILSQAVDSARELLPQANHFLRALGNIGLAGVVTGHFPLADLLKLDPNCTSDHVMSFVTPLPHQRQMHQAGQTANWHGMERETAIAATLANAFPTIMMDNLLSAMSVSFTNRAPMPDCFRFIPEKVKSFTNLPVQDYVLRAMRRVEVELMADLSYNNDISYDILVNCNVFGETHVRVQLNRNEPQDYVYPSFCDSLLAPVIAPNPKVASVTAGELRRLAEHGVNSTGDAEPVTSVFSPANNLF